MARRKGIIDMRSVSVLVIIISVAYANGWSRQFPSMTFDRIKELDFINFTPNPLAKVTKHWIQQPFDHFDKNETRQFNMRYYKRLDFWKPKGPIYIWIFNNLISCEQHMSMDNHIHSILAKETNGAMFLSQTRYHGESKLDLPDDHNYFKFLNTTQSLADIANLIKFLKSLPEFQSSKVVLIGVQLSGNLVTWTKVVYPHLVDAVLAASAPLLAKKESKELLDHTRYVYGKYGPKGCLEQIKKEFLSYEHAFHNATALKELKRTFNICEDNTFSAIPDRENFMELVYYLYFKIASYGYMKGIKRCEKLNFIVIGCWDLKYNPSSLEWSMRNPFAYQLCTEYGQFLYTGSDEPPFAQWLPLDFSLKSCVDYDEIDEKRMDEGIAQTNRMFGGITPNVTNVVFTHGELDPNRLLGVQQNLSDLAPAFVAKECGTSCVIYSWKQEPKESIEIRNRVKSLIKKWIS